MRHLVGRKIWMFSLRLLCTWMFRWNELRFGRHRRRTFQRLVRVRSRTTRPLLMRRMSTVLSRLITHTSWGSMFLAVALLMPLSLLMSPSIAQIPLVMRRRLLACLMRRCNLVRRNRIVLTLHWRRVRMLRTATFRQVFPFGIFVQW